MSTLKSLQTELKEKTREINKVVQNIDLDTAYLKDIQSERQEIKRKLMAMTKEVKVSEHAMLRYLERVEGLDMEALKEKVIPKDLREKFKVLGNAKIPVGNSHRAVMKDNVIVSVSVYEF